MYILTENVLTDAHRSPKSITHTFRKIVGWVLLVTPGKLFLIPKGRIIDPNGLNIRQATYKILVYLQLFTVTGFSYFSVTLSI